MENLISQLKDLVERTSSNEFEIEDLLKEILEEWKELTKKAPEMEFVFYSEKDEDYITDYYLKTGSDYVWTYMYPDFADPKDGVKKYLHYYELSREVIEELPRVFEVAIRDLSAVAERQEEIISTLKKIVEALKS